MKNAAGVALLHARVRALATICDGAECVDAGAVGTVIDVRHDDEDFVIEFTAPRRVIVSARRCDVEVIEGAGVAVNRLERSRGA